MNRQQIDDNISLPQGHPAGRALTCCDSGSGFYLCELSGDDRMPTGWIG
jgi:hypothetical protein